MQARRKCRLQLKVWFPHQLLFLAPSLPVYSGHCTTIRAAYILEEELSNTAFGAAQSPPVPAKPGSPLPLPGKGFPLWEARSGCGRGWRGAEFFVWRRSLFYKAPLSPTALLPRLCCKLRTHDFFAQQLLHPCMSGGHRVWTFLSESFIYRIISKGTNESPRLLGLVWQVQPIIVMLVRVTKCASHII